MTRIARLFRDRGGSAAAEMALVLPLLLILFIGAVEMGNYFYNEHILVKGLRDGARYAGRQGFLNYNGCSGSVPTPGTAGSPFENTRSIVRTGRVSGGSDRLPNWTAAGTSFTATITCTTTSGGLTLTGIYRDNKNGAGALVGAPVVTVSATLPYRPLFAAYVFPSIGLTLNASQQAAVMGI